MEKEALVYYTHTHTHIQYYSALFQEKKKKNEIVPYATAWMALEIIMLSEISKTKTDVT